MEQINPDLFHLRAHGLISQHLADRIHHEIRFGGSLINHLHHQLGSDLEQLWADLAAERGLKLLPSPASFGPINTTLLSLQDALSFLVLPRVQRFNRIHVVTPNPFVRTEDLQPLTGRLGHLFTTGQVQLVLELTTPDVFREVFRLAYPNHERHHRSVADAAALAALIPAGNPSIKPTPEEHARAIATVTGLPYLDPHLTPPDPGVPAPLPTGPFLAKRLYPHSRDTRGHLIVLGSVEHAEETAELRARVQQLQDALRHPLSLHLTSQRRIAALSLARHKDEP